MSVLISIETIIEYWFNYSSSSKFSFAAQTLTFAAELVQFAALFNAILDKQKLILITVTVSSEISDICEISELLLFLKYLTSQNKEINCGNLFFDVCCVNWNILVRCQVPTTSYSTGITWTIENFRTLIVDLNYFFFWP